MALDTKIRAGNLRHPKNHDVLRKELIDYIFREVLSSREKNCQLTAFKRDEKWYFNASWLDQNHVGVMKELGFIEKIGTVGTIDSSIELIFERYRLLRGNVPSMRNTLIYIVIDSEANNLISGKVRKSQYASFISRKNTN